MVLIGNSSVAFGGGDDLYTLPILNLPDDAVRVKRVIRNTDFARAFVKTPCGIRSFFLDRVEGGLNLVFEQGGNVRQTVQPCCA